VLKYYVRQVNTNGNELIYDGTNTYSIFHKEKKIIADVPAVSGKKFTRNTIKRDLVPDFLYSDTYLERIATDATKLTLLGSSTIKGSPCWEIEVTLPVDEEITMMKFIFSISKKTYLPVKKVSFAKYKDVQDEYQEWFISNLSVSSAEKKNFASLYKYPSGYAVQQYKAVNIDYSMLSVGSNPIDFVLEDITGKEYNLAALKNDKVILLDFWFLACAPCMKAMPQIAALYKQYESKGLLVLGLNSFDKGTERITEVKKMLARMDITYPVLLCDKKLEADYKITTYPSVYIIEKGKIILTELGYTEEGMKNIKQLLSAKFN
jgi:thiol-disulfide isomerase/thioredoxin